MSDNSKWLRMTASELRSIERKVGGYDIEAAVANRSNAYHCLAAAEEIEALETEIKALSSKLEAAEKEAARLVGVIGEHVTVRGEYYDRIKALESRLDALQNEPTYRIRQEQAERIAELEAELLCYDGDLREQVKSLSSRLDYFRQRSLQRGATGTSCRICQGAWAHTRGEGELHEQWCPNYPATHHAVVVERQNTK